MRPTSTSGQKELRIEISRWLEPKEWIAAASGCKVSTIAVNGTTSVWLATVTTMPSSTASVSGRLMVKVEPWPGREEMLMRPPSA
ncbi:hypothetical protein D3C78_1262670 [compost metagenome]